MKREATQSGRGREIFVFFTYSLIKLDDYHISQCVMRSVTADIFIYFLSFYQFMYKQQTTKYWITNEKETLKSRRSRFIADS